MKRNIIYTVFLTIGFLFACSAANAYGQEHPNAPEKPKATKYTCPMHPEVVEDKPGKCPKCGMALEKQKEPLKEAIQDKMKVKHNKADTAKMKHRHRTHKDSMRMDKKVRPDSNKIILK